MGTQVDRLEIEIAAEAGKANNQIDLMIKRLGELANTLESIGAKIGNFEKLGNVFNQKIDTGKFKDITKDAGEFEKRLKDVGKNLNFSGNLFEINKEIESVEKRLDKLLVKEEKFNILGKNPNQTAYKNLQYDIAEACNYLDILYDKQVQLKNEHLQISENGQPYKEWFDSTEDSAEELKKRLQNVGQALNVSCITAQAEKADQVLKQIGREAENIENKSNKSGISRGISQVVESLHSVSCSDMFSKMSAGIKDFQTKLGRRIPTEEYSQLTANIQKAEAAYQKLLDKQDRMEAQGISQNSASWKGLQYDIRMAADCVAELNRDMELLKAHGGDTERLSSGFRIISGSVAGVSAAFKRISGGLHSFAEKIKNTMTGLASTRNEVNKFSISLTVLVKSLTRVSNLLKMMVVRLALKAVINNVGGAIQHLSWESAEFNIKISDLLASCKQLAHSIAALGAPLMNLFGPALSYIVNLLHSAVNAMNQFLSAFAGKSVYNRAIKQNYDYASSLQKAAGAAKDLKTTTLGIDELNINGGDDDSSSGSGGDNDFGDYYELAKIDSGIKSLADRIREILKTDDWFEIGAIIANKLNEILASIPWKKIYVQAEHIAKGIGTLINGFVKTLDWFMVGYTIAQGLNVALNFVGTLLETIDYKMIGAGIINAIGGFFDTFSWSALASVFSSVFKALLDFFTGIVETIDWCRIPRYIMESIGEFLTGFDWNGTSRSLGELLGAAVRGAIELAGTVWDMLREAWGDLSDYFSAYIRAAGGDIIAGLLYGIVDALTNVGGWINDNIFSPFLSGFKSAFGINSPSTVMIEQGGYIIAGLWQGISEMMCICGEKIKEIADSILGFFVELPGKFLEIGTNIITGLWQGIQDAWSGVKKGVSDFCSGFVDGFREALDIHSPSRKMSEIGDYAVLGLLEPFNDFGGLEQIQMFANSMLEVISQALNPETFSFMGQAAMNALLSAFSLETLQPAFENINLALQTVWIETMIWWQETAMPMWFEEGIIPWFSQEIWFELTAGMKLGILNQWTEFTKLWKKEFQKWWNTDVMVWFTVVKWNLFGQNMKEGIYTGFKGVVQMVGGIMNGIIDVFHAGLRQIQDAINALVDEFNAIAGKLGVSKLSHVHAQNIAHVKIPAFAEGGYPETGELFLARENGINEMVGRIGGRSAVANNDQIIEGVKQGVYEAVVAAMAGVMSQREEQPIVVNTTVEMDGRAIVQQTDEARRRMGWSFQPV